MALVTAFLGRRSLARSLAADARRAVSVAQNILRGAGRILRVGFETDGEAQDLRRQLVRKYPFSDI